MPGEKRKAVKTNTPKKDGASGNKSEDTKEIKKPVYKKSKGPKVISIKDELEKIQNTQVAENRQKKTSVKAGTSLEIGESSFTAKDVCKQINEFVVSEKLEASKRTVFSAYEPEILHKTDIYFRVESKLETETVKNFKAILEKRLRKNLDNKNIKVFSRVVNKSEEKTLLVTDKQKYDYLVKRNPLVDKMREKLGLDL